MIVVAFVLTVVGNWVWMEESNMEGVADDGGWRGVMESMGMLIPLKGRFSIVFFQLMLMTSVQIIYETVSEMYWRFKEKAVHFIDKNKNALNRANK